jgi:hypothetical protein
MYCRLRGRTARRRPGPRRAGQQENGNSTNLWNTEARGQLAVRKASPAGMCGHSGEGKSFFAQPDRQAKSGGATVNTTGDGISHPAAWSPIVA